MPIPSDQDPQPGSTYDPVNSPTRVSVYLSHLAGHRLTPRERQCLAMIAAEGLTSQQIAHALSLSVGAVNNYLARARAKLGAPNRANAMYLALQTGQLDADTLGGALGYLALKAGLLAALEPDLERAA